MPAQTSRTGRIAVRLAPFLAALASVLAFLPALRCGFVSWDDPLNLLDNPHYRGFGWDNLGWMFTTLLSGNYQPLSWLTLAADYKLWGMGPHGYHLTNVLIHAANAALLCALCTSLLSLPPQRNRRPLIGGAGGEAPDGRLARKDGWSLAVAALFGALFWSLHPLRVESVAWITERRDVLSTFFFLITILCYLRWAQREDRRWRWATLAAYALSLLSKAMAMTLPVVLLILDFYPLRRRRLLEKLPFAALGAAAAGLGYAAQVQTKATSSLADFGLPERLAHAAYDLVFYLGKTLVPTGLSPFYEMLLPFNPFAPSFLLSALAACAIAVLVWLSRRRLPGLAAAMGFYAVTVSPVLGLVAVGSLLAADRYTYIPTLGFSVLAAGWLQRRRGSSLAVATALLLALGALSWRQCGFWHDSDALWGRVLALDPSSATAHHNLGVMRTGEKDYPAAIRMYQAALTARPHTPLVREALAQAAYNQANADLHSGRREEALRLYRQVLSLSPAFAEAHNNLGLALAEAGRRAEARVQYERALSLKPGFAAAHYNLGNVLAEEGRLAQAEVEFRRAAALDEALLDARFNLGNTLAREGRYGEAAEQYRAVLRKSPSFPQAQENLAQVRRLGP